MPHRPTDDDDWSEQEDFDDDSADAESDEYPCPACGRSIYDDAEKCPYCGEWITPPGTAETRSRSWFWPILVALLVVVILMAWHGVGR
ncbi:MAG: zinc ribbon domain-containing protein [Phycisphaerae bacterium]